MTEPTTFDFEDGRGPVPAHRHRNPDGSVGGWVSGTALVSATCAGTGKRSGGFSVKDGAFYRDCERCGTTGKAGAP